MGGLFVHSRSHPDHFTESQGATVCHTITVMLDLVCASRHCHDILQKSSHANLLAQIGPETLLLLKFVIAGLHSSTGRLWFATLYYQSFTTYIFKHSSPFAVATWPGWGSSLINFWQVRGWLLSLFCVLKSVKSTQKVRNNKLNTHLIPKLWQCS